MEWIDQARRDALKGVCVGVGLGILGCTTRSDDQLTLTDVSPPELDALRQVDFARPLLNAGSQALARDEEVRGTISKLLGNIVLARKWHRFRVRDEDMFQLRQVRLDTTAYRVNIRDKETLRSIVVNGSVVADAVKKQFPKGFGDLDIVAGSFVWIRQLRSRANAEEALKPSQKELAEIYWLDIYVKYGDIVLPRLRIHWDSIGFVPHIPPFASRNYVIEAVSTPTVFIDSMSVVMDWHELAHTFGLQNSAYYLRTWLLSANHQQRVWVSGFEPWQSLYLPPGSGSNTDAFVASLPPVEIGSLLTCPPDNHCVSLSEMPAAGPFPEGELNGFQQLVESEVPGALYLGDGRFSVRYAEVSPPPASFPSNRHSEPTSVTASGATAVDLLLTPAGAFAAGTAAGIASAVALGNFVQAQLRTEAARMLARTQIQQTSESCARDSMNEAECLLCIQAAGFLDAEIQELNDERAIVIAVNQGTAIIAGCVTAGLIMLAAGGSGAVILLVCGLAALFATGGALVETVNDMASIDMAISQSREAAFTPCMTMPISFDVDDIECPSGDASNCAGSGPVP